MATNKSYSELMRFSTYEDRFNYLRVGQEIGYETFGPDRYLNQILYSSKEWKQFRNKIILRDNGCDLGLPGYDIHGRATIHHINPITVEDVVQRDPKVFDPENVICVSDDTHKAIHYNSDPSKFIPLVPKERYPGDTAPWKK